MFPKSLDRDLRCLGATFETKVDKENESFDIFKFSPGSQDCQLAANRPGERCLIRVPAADTNGAYSFVEIVSDPGDGTPLHVHQNEDEYLFVLEGDSALRGRRQDIRCGSWNDGHASQKHSSRLGQSLDLTAADCGDLLPRRC